MTGEVRLQLEPGRAASPAGARPTRLYDYGLATYDAADAFHHEDAAGFVRLWGLVGRRPGRPPGPAEQADEHSATAMIAG